jgi:hypothetical protein
VNTTHLFSAARLIATHALPSEVRDAGIIPAVRQAAGEMPTLISLFDSGMGVDILPASAVRPSVAPAVTYELADKRPNV